MSFFAIASMRWRSSSMIFSALPAIWMTPLGGGTRDARAGRCWPTGAPRVRRLAASSPPQRNMQALITRARPLEVVQLQAISGGAGKSFDRDQRFRLRRGLQEWRDALERW